MEPMRAGELISKRLPVVGGVLFVAAVFGFCVWAPWARREPVYNGKPLSYWLSYSPPITGSIPSGFDFAPVSPDLARKIVADDHAVPFLVKAMLGHDRRLGNAYFSAWLKMPLWMQRLLPPPPYTGYVERMRAGALLSEMGAIGKVAAPSLVRLLNADEDFNIRKQAALALGNLGEGDGDAIPALTAALMDKYLTVRMAATNALRKIDPEVAAKAGVKPPPQK
jgi:hypothetical protein